jgi:hypothetical protein
MALNERMSSTTLLAAKACPPWLWRAPAIETLTPEERAAAKACRTSSGLRTMTMFCTRVGLRQLTSLISGPAPAAGAA